MAYIRKDEVIDALREDKEETLMCYEGEEEKEIIKFCYENMEREIDRLPQYYPENCSECVEKPKISRLDMMFLECISKAYEYMAKDMDGEVYIFQKKPLKMIDVWDDEGGIPPVDISGFGVKFPMVKWEDHRPWLIEDLKRLEMVEEYE